MNANVDRLKAALADRYRIERELGAGGMATVYLAEDLKHDRRVAIKVLKPELAAVLGADRFVVEIKTTAAMSHPHILPLFDSGTADGFLYYVMPYIQGETIREKLNRETQWGVEEAVRIAREVADALDYAHRHGVIHRDIKPENILLHDGRAMVMDFGIALAVSAAAGGRMTETGLSLGTPHYMSPEQATAEKEITARSDVYSLASVLYEMLAGQPPHIGGAAQQVIMKIITEPAQPVTTLRKTVPPNVAAAVAKALEKLPADRFVSAAEFARALGDATFQRAGGPETTKAAATRRIPAWKLAAASVVLLGAGTALGSLLSRAEAPPRQVVRFTVPIPPSLQLPGNSSWDAPFALSQDGSRLAYLASDSAVTSYRVRVRHMDQFTSMVLPGTEDAVNPFFSPDGKWIGFVGRGNVLRKVAATGGPVSPLGPPDAATGSGAASWGDDGFIVYPRLNQLARISEGGGEVTMITDSATVAYAGAPTVLPGGRSVLTVACVKQPESDSCASGLYVLDVPTRKLTLLVDRASRGWYLPDGHLVYATVEGALYAMRFDPGKLAVSGAPVALLDGVAISQGRFARVALAPATGAMAYLPNVGNEQVVIVRVDRDGREQVLVDAPGSYAGVRLSPNERRILLTMPDASGGLQAWIHDRASATTTQLTFDGTNIRPAWSPSGDRIAFTSNRRTRFYLWTMPSDGSDKGERAGEGPEINGPTSVHWTRDGKWLVVDGAPEDGKSPGGEDIFAIPTAGQRTMLPVVATAASEQSGEVSPDGKWVAYLSNDTGRYHLYVQPFLAPGGRTLISAGGAQEPAWVSNHEIAYVNTDVDSMVVARLEFGPTITVSRTTLFDHRPYQSGGISQRSYDVMRDGRTFIFARPVNERHVVEPVVVLNWVQEVRRLMAAAGVKE